MRYTVNQDGYCICCKNVACDPHESHGGRNRQLSIKYRMVYAVCRKCHREIHDNPRCEKDLMLRELGREKFELENPELDFKKVFI